MFGSRYSRMAQVQFFKGCLPQILLGPFLNTLTHLCVSQLSSKRGHHKYYYEQLSVKNILSTTKMLLVGSAFNKSENCRPVLFLKEKYCQNVSIEFNCFGVYVSKQSRCFFLRLHYSLIKFHTFLVDREHQRNHHFHERYLHLKPMSNY